MGDSARPVWDQTRHRKHQLAAADRSSARAIRAAVLAAVVLGLSPTSAAARLVAFVVPNNTQGVPALTSLTAGPRGEVWFGDQNGFVGHADAHGSVAEIPVRQDGEYEAVNRVAARSANSLWISGTGLQWFSLTTGTVTNTPPIPQEVGSAPLTWMTQGYDGNLWLVHPDAARIVRVLPSGQSRYWVQHRFPKANYCCITRGAGRRMWFSGTTLGGKAPPFIASISSSGQMRLYPDNGALGATFLAPGPHGSMWFDEQRRSGEYIVLQSASGRRSRIRFRAPRSGSVLGMASDAAGTAWVTWTSDDGSRNGYARITPRGKLTVFRLRNDALVDEIIRGPAGHVWFTELDGGRDTPTVAKIDEIVGA